MARSRFISRRRFRRRVSPYDLQTQVIPRTGISVSNVSTTVNPTIIATNVAGPYDTGNPAFNEATIDMKGSKMWTFGGMHFQSEYSFNPSAGFGATWIGATDVFQIYEAICVLPFAQGSFAAPAYLPNFTNAFGGFQTGDEGDRILWKRINQLPYWGVAIIGTSQLEATMRDVGHGPQQIKAKARLDERHGVFHVANIIHGVAAESNSTWVWDFWSRTAIKASR